MHKICIDKRKCAVMKDCFAVKNPEERNAKFIYWYVRVESYTCKAAKMVIGAFWVHK